MNYIKGGLKVFTGYLMSLLVFVIFLYLFISVTKDSFYAWLPLYSFILFVLMFLIIYSDMRKLAVKERKPQYNLNPYPFKGLVLGLIGFSPLILLELVYPLLIFGSEPLNRVKHLVLNTLMGPLYFVVRLGNGSVWAYAAASLVVPVIAMLAYLAGYYGFELMKFFGIGKNKADGTAPKFTKSPWNPSITKDSGKKKTR